MRRIAVTRPIGPVRAGRGGDAFLGLGRSNRHLQRAFSLSLRG